MNAGLGNPFVGLFHQDHCLILIKLNGRHVNFRNLEDLVICPILGIHRVLLEQLVDGVNSRQRKI